MKTRSGATNGATLVLVVLFTMLLLAGILAATMRLSLGSRQNTSDQKVTVQTQYGAESAVSLAQSRLRDVQDMLTYTPRRLNSASPAPSPPIQALALARNTKLSALQGWMNSLCGTATWAPIYEGKAKNDPGYFDPGPSSTTDTDDTLYPSAQACVPTGWTSASQFVLFAKIVTDAAYTLLPVGERPAANETAEQTFWYDLFRQNKTDSSSMGSAVTDPTLVRIIRLTSSHYRIFVNNPSLTASASQANGVQRTISGRPTQDSTWWFDVNQPGLLDAVIQTDYQTSLSGSTIYFTTATRFQGPIKTNDVFAFVSSAGNNNPSFSGQISSAGCTTRTSSTTDSNCTREPGVRVNSSSATRFTGTTDASKSTKVKNYIANNGVNINYNGTEPNFASEYQPFPEAALIQQNAAQGKDEDGTTDLPGNQRGLTLSGSQVGVQMYVGDANGNAVNSYNATTRTWGEPSPAYQYIKPLIGTGCGTAVLTVTSCTYDAIIYRVDKDGNMEQGTGTPLVWVAIPGTKTKFNGVIYKSGKMTVVGPGRGSGTTPEGQARPAIASFSGITLAATDDLTVQSDLAMSQSPCRYNEYPTVQLTPPCRERSNVLGVFSSTGSVIVGKQVPNNPVLQAAIMSSSEEVTVAGFDSGSARGTLKFTGSMVEKYYGANGTFGGQNGSTGYDRDYSYDRRFSDGLIPPFYPTSPKWAFDDASDRNVDLSDIIWKQGSN